ncbi:MAG: hypothetical protein Q8908_09710, partial [Bacteroidota bacterium]|nr:hypothetical protein [Bacteroidota bacterium]
IRSLDIANKCDLSYRTSSNKRLHIEIALLQMTRMNLPTSHGHTAPQPQQPTTPVVTPSPVRTPDPAPQSSTSPNEVAKSTVQDPQALYRNQSVTEHKPAQQTAKPIPASNPAPAILPDKMPHTTSIRAKAKVLPTTTSITQGISNGGSADASKEKNSASSASEKEDPEPNDEAERNDPPTESGSKKEPLTQQSLEQAWENLQKHFPDLISLTIRKPVLKKAGKIEYPVASQLEESEIFQNRYDILLYLKQELGNARIELETILTEEAPQERKAYTDKDKYEYLATRNPLLNKFREKFDLELLY